MGTVNLLDAVREVKSVRAVVVVTSDKCYENRGWEWGYREDEAMGGHDPYSSSKGAAELVVGAYRRSFFSDPAGPRGGVGARRQRDRRRGLGSRAPHDRSGPRRAQRRDAAHPQPRRGAPVAARAQSAERIPGARRGAVASPRRSRTVGTSGPRRGTPSPWPGWSSECASAGRAGRRGTPTRGRILTRPPISSSTRREHGCVWAGGRWCRSRPPCAASSLGMRRSRPAPICASSPSTQLRSLCDATTAPPPAG